MAVPTEENNYMRTWIHTLITPRLEADMTGATAVEYGMLVALIAAVIVGVVTLLGSSVNAAFTSIANAI